MILDEILEVMKKSKQFNAYSINDKTYSYEELYKYVCNIYSFLQAENPEKQPVIVYGHKDIYMKSTFIACSMAGMAYVPIDKEIAVNRAKNIIDQVKPKILIGDFYSANVKQISQKQIEKVMNNENYREIYKIDMKPDDIYYIIFTSGSTGMPKGVKITYRNVNSCVNWLKEILGTDRGIILNQAAFSFDLSVADLYYSLITGSNHFIIEKDIQSNFKAMFELLKNSNSTIAVMTPSFADLLLLDKSFNDNLMPNLKKIVFCGESLLKTTVDKIYSRFKNLKIINCYGPTEATFAVTSIDIKRNEDEISIGKPKKDVNIYIVDDNLKELQEGEIGEILIAGESVAEGYLKENASNKFIEYNNQKAYLTGDLGYIKNDKLYYKCRKDNQIKFKGYRIEIADIENNLNELEYVEKAVVVAKMSANEKVSRLIAFVKLKTSKNILEIREDLLKKIPEYMCPTIRIIDKFPINQNGKCDMKKLMEVY